VYRKAGGEERRQKSGDIGFISRKTIQNLRNELNPKLKPKPLSGFNCMLLSAEKLMLVSKLRNELNPLNPKLKPKPPSGFNWRN
jgi:hypothetical protein